MSDRRIDIPAEVIAAVKQQAEEEAPNEACGYLVGRIEAGSDGPDSPGGASAPRSANGPGGGNGPRSAEELEAGEASTGEVRVVTRHIRMTNADASPEHFSFRPQEQFDALKSARDSGEQLVGVYHSHPETPARMSEEDIRLANDVNTIYVIHSLATGETKAFSVTKDKEVLTVAVGEGVKT